MNKEKKPNVPPMEDSVATTNWLIHNFPEHIKNQFCGVAKTRSVNVGELLSQIIINWLVKEGEFKDYNYFKLNGKV